MLHAIGNNQSGGFQIGFLSDEYQSPVGNNLPVEAATEQAIKKIMKVKKSILLTLWEINFL